MRAMEHATAEELAAGIDEVRRAPRELGRVELIVRRPAEEDREIVLEGEIDAVDGLVGDSWRIRGSSRTPDGSADPEAQLTIMSSRAVHLVARTRDRWQLAGDQVFVDFDISMANLPAGTRLEVGSAIVEVTPKPHLGCQKFSRRFGVEALKVVNSPIGRSLRLRGLNARVVVPGRVRVGDIVRKAEIDEIAAAG